MAIAEYPEKNSYYGANCENNQQHNENPVDFLETNTHNIHDAEGEGKEVDNLGEDSPDEVYYYGPTRHNYILFYADVVSLIISVLISIHYYPIMPESQPVLVLAPCTILATVLVTRFVEMVFQGMGVAWLIIQVLYIFLD